MANPLAWLLGGAFALTVGAVVYGGEDDEGPSYGGGGGGDPLPELTCDQAIANIPDASLRTSVQQAITTSTNATALKMLALSLETAAGAPELPALGRAALLRAAKCVRDRAAIVGLSLPSSSSASASLASAAPLKFDPATAYRVNQAQPAPFGFWKADT